MSSIIDALKKSDKNRNQNGSGSVNQIKFESEQKPRSRRGFYLLVVVLLLVAMGVLAWQQGWIAATKNKFFNSPEPSTAAATEHHMETVNPATENRATKPKGVNKLTPPKADDIRQKSNNPIAAKEPSAADADSMQPVNQQPDNQSAKPAVTAIQQPTESIDTVDSIEPVEDTAISQPIAQETSTEADQRQRNKDKAPPKKPQKARQSDSQEHLMIHQLDFEVRRSIPPVKLNIHIYDPEPENRMVIINGVKFVTGDVIEEAITVQEINQKGVVLEFGGTTFLIPK